MQEAPYYLAGFLSWLKLMNYTESSLYDDPIRISHFLEWMESEGIRQVDQMHGKKVAEFFEVLSRQKAKRSGEVLSLATQRNYLMSIKRFARYLKVSGEGILEVPVRLGSGRQKPIVIVSPEEIERLYQATDEGVLGIRDRALLAICYGCGLRRNEALHLKVADLLLARSLVYVRKAKGHRERYVPMIGRVRADLLQYLQTARPMLIRAGIADRLFIGITGKPLSSNALYERIRSLARKAGIEKAVSLHSLRHSIATHLLQRGMKLTDIAQFLGHRSLSSTQIYTHLPDGLSL